MSKFLQWVGSIALAAIILAAAYASVKVLWNVGNTGKLPNLTSDRAEMPATSNLTVKVVMDEKMDLTKPSDKLVKVEEGYLRRDVTGMPELTEWVNLARKVGEDVPSWLVPVQMVNNVPYLVFSDELDKGPDIVIPDEYRDLYQWHQVSVDEVGVMNIVLERTGKTDSYFSFQKQTLRFIGKVWVLEKIEAVLETPATTTDTPLTPETAKGEDPPGTKTVTAPPEP